MVKSAKLREDDRGWFPRWLDAYRRFCDVGRNDSVPVHRELLVAFLRQEKARGRKAWQRLQIVRAVEHYRNAILGTAAPELGHIRDTLAQVAERGFGPTHDIDVVGIIDSNEPEPIQALRRELRLLHHRQKTEKAYVLRVSQFMRRFKILTLADLAKVGEGEIIHFLTEIAVEENVASSTQNQAFNALLFLFRRFLQREPQFIDAVRATGPQRLPVVLSRDEVDDFITSSRHSQSLPRGDAHADTIGQTPQLSLGLT